MMIILPQTIEVKEENKIINKLNYYKKTKYLIN